MVDWAQNTKYQLTKLLLEQQEREAVVQQQRQLCSGGGGGRVRTHNKNNDTHIHKKATTVTTPKPLAFTASKLLPVLQLKIPPVAPKPQAALLPQQTFRRCRDGRPFCGYKVDFVAAKNKQTNKPKPICVFLKQQK